MNMLHVKARTGETVIDDQRRKIDDVGGKVPSNQFWLRRIANGEVSIIHPIEFKFQPKLDVKLD